MPSAAFTGIRRMMKSKMKDKGFVVSVTDDLARVEVQCLIEACSHCPARSICVGQDKSKGLLDVQNPLQAGVGDEVEIEIPETKYNQALILLFGSLLIAVLLGTGAGYLLSFLLPVSSSAASLFGLILSVAVAVGILFHHFRRKLTRQLYPIVTSILKKGDRHG